MPSFTKKAIKESFLKLLNERPISQITVRDVVEDCGINRNSFYYHYQDLQALVVEILRENTDRILAEGLREQSVEACLDAAVDFAVKNRRAVLHICNSGSRETYERELSRICDYASQSYMEQRFRSAPIDPEDQQALVFLLKCVLYGLTMDWLNDAMRYDIRARYHRICTMLKEIPVGRLPQQLAKAAQETG